MPIVAFVAGYIYGGGWRGALVSTGAYFIGIAAVICSGIILKKFKAFAGHPSPFVMELPEYHVPAAKNVFKSTFDRGWGFVKRAGTVILIASVLIWVGQNVSLESSASTEYSVNEDGSFVTDGEGNIESGVHAHFIYDDAGNVVGYEKAEHTGLHFIENGCTSKSILQMLGELVSLVFKPLGFGDSWEASVATILGLVAKEEVVGALGTMAQGGLEGAADEFFDGSFLKGISFLIFNLLCAPCFAAIGAIKNEMNNRKWTWATLGYMTGLAYAASLVTYQIGKLIRWGSFSFWTLIAFAVLAVFLYLLFKPAKFSIIDTCKRVFTKKNEKTSKSAQA